MSTTIHNNSPIRPMLFKDRRVIMLFVEKCIVNINRAALTFQDVEGRKEIPIGQLAVLFLGVGTSITAEAIKLCAENNVVVIWCATGVTSFYAHGNSIGRSGVIIGRQSSLHSLPLERNKVARKMFLMRFPDETEASLIKLSSEQLRSKEGTRVRKAYIEQASKYGLQWEKRISRMDSIADDDLLNKAITLGTSNLYGLVHSLTVAIGASPALGFVHEGHALSFVYDIADLYKTELVVPTVFALLAKYKDLMGEQELADSLDKLIRIEMREMFRREKLVMRIVKDIKGLLLLDEDMIFNEADIVFLWGKDGLVSSGTNWGNE